MFYERFIELCKDKGVRPSIVAKEIGLSNAAPTYWKNGSVPKASTIQAIANYFGVSTDYLIGLSNSEPISRGNDDIFLLQQTFSENIRCLRKYYRLSQSDLAKKMGIDLSTIRNVENPNSGYFPQTEVLLSFAEFFGIDIKYIKGTSTTAEEMCAMHTENLKREIEIALGNLNILGWQKALERVEELTEIPKYQIEKAPSEDG